MRRFWILLFPLFAFGAPVGNTAAPGLIEKGFFSTVESSFRIGYEGDFVADGRMEQVDQGNGRVDTYKQYTNSGTFTLNFMNRLDLYAVFGSSKTKADWRIQNETSIHRIKMKTDKNFLWAAGARAILFEWMKTYLGCGGRFSSTTDKPVWLTSDGVSIPVEGTHFHWEQWQVNLDICYRISFFTPYIGVKYSSEKAHLGTFNTSISDSGSGSDSFKNRDPVGLYLGCALSNGHYFMANLEGRLIDEEAITLSADFRF
jgi:hypothetical protein